MVARALVILVFVTLVVEYLVFREVSARIGGGTAVWLLIMISLGGIALLRREGLRVLRELQGQLVQGQAPGQTAVQGILLLGSGALLLFPGFVTDVFALILLVPWTRRLMGRSLVPYLGRHVRPGMSIPGIRIHTVRMSGMGAPVPPRSPTDELDRRREEAEAPHVAPLQDPSNSSSPSDKSKRTKAPIIIDV